jgi:hypothetical protein
MGAQLEGSKEFAKRHQKFKASSKWLLRKTVLKERN